jgi:hydroxyacyl-ACP dehydratase HTD2-like protein with hotdog domain
MCRMKATTSFVLSTTFVCRSKVLDVYEKTGRSGPMAFVQRETSVVDSTNEVVAFIRHITVVRL